MSRYLGIDWGEKYIGLAISDPLGVIAQGLDVIEFKNEKSFFEYLKDILQKYDIKGIVIGYPISLRGHENEKTEKIKELSKKIEEKFKIKTYLIDERFTTMEVEKVLIEANVKRKDRKIIKNKQSAIIILQKFLSSLRLDTEEQEKV